MMADDSIRLTSGANPVCSFVLDIIWACFANKIGHAFEIKLQLQQVDDR